MMQLKPFTTKTEPVTSTRLFPATILYIAGQEVGYITRNLAGLKSGSISYAFIWKMQIGFDKLVGNDPEALKEDAINKFRSFINSVLE